MQWLSENNKDQYTVLYVQSKGGNVEKRNFGKQIYLFFGAEQNQELHQVLCNHSYMLVSVCGI